MTTVIVNNLACAIKLGTRLLTVQLFFRSDVTTDSTLRLLTKFPYWLRMNPPLCHDLQNIGDLELTEQKKSAAIA